MSESDKTEQNLDIKKSKPGEYLIIILTCIITGALFLQSIKLEGIFQGASSSTGAFPQIMTSIVLLLIFFEIVKLYKNNYKQGKLKDILTYMFPREVILLIVLVAAYAFLLEKLHFTASTLLFLWIGMFVFDSKRPVNKLIISVGVLVAVLLIFKVVFKVLLP